MLFIYQTIVLDETASIINYFSGFLSYQVFIQGFFVLNALILSMALLYYVSNHDHKANEPFFSFYIRFIFSKLNYIYRFPKVEGSDLNEKNTQLEGTNYVKSIDTLVSHLTAIGQFLNIIVIVIVLSYCFGIIVNNLSDSFMDRPDYFHLGLKRNWDKTELKGYDVSQYVNTDERIKINVFDKIFYELKDLKGDSGFSSSFKKEIYYNTKHKILADTKWQKYLTYSQDIVNLCQSICFSCWLLLFFSFLSFFIAATNQDKITYYKNALKNKTKSVLSILLEPIMNGLVIIYIPSIIILPFIFPEIPIRFYIILPFILCVSVIILMAKKYIKSHRIITSFCFIIMAIIGYHASAIAWRNAEIETCTKTFGLYKYLDSTLTNREAFILRDVLIKVEKK